MQEYYVYIEVDAIKEHEPMYSWDVKGSIFGLIDKKTKKLVIRGGGGVVRDKTLEGCIKKVVETIEKYTDDEDKVSYIIGRPPSTPTMDKPKGALEILKESKELYKKSYPEDKESIKIYEISETYLKQKEEQITELIKKYQRGEMK